VCVDLGGLCAPLGARSGELGSKQPPPSVPSSARVLRELHLDYPSGGLGELCEFVQIMVWRSGMTLGLHMAFTGTVKII
jgi:hypothetical protein